MSLKRNIDTIFKKIRDRKFMVRVKKFFKSSITSFSESGGLHFYVSPAGKSHHHSYTGGLAQHTLSTVKIALMLVEVLEKVYCCKGINKDYVLAGALLHDLYKPLTYTQEEDGKFDFSGLGERLDHLSMLVAEAYKQGLPLDFIHVLAASHGEASPIPPRTVEALIVHLADLIDSKLVGELQRAALSIARKCGVEEFLSLTPKDSLQIIQFKSSGGCEKVKLVAEKLRKKFRG
ncbi:MAG: HD domain-containing protein [Candidatus Bathyarchaeota archaeon]|nr:HD domain-containing protein [Candidatus Bathyarchaeota archaeon]